MKKLLVKIVICLFTIGLAFFGFNNIENAYATVSPQIVNKQLQTLVTGEYWIHSSGVVSGYFFAGTRASPAKLLRFYDLDDLSKYDVKTFNDNDDSDGIGYSRHINAESFVYVPSRDRIYIHFSQSGSSAMNIAECDPDDIINGCHDFIMSNDPGGTSSGIASDGTYLYVLTYATPAKIFKYLLSDQTLVASSTINDGIEDKRSGHNLMYDSTTGYLYGTGIGVSSVQAGWMVKINPTDLTYAVANLVLPERITDDFADAGDYIFCGLEVNTGDIVRFKKSDLSVTRIPTGNTNTGELNYGTYFDGTNVWAIFANTFLDLPGVVTKIDPNTFAVTNFTLNTGENQPNEVVIDGEGKFIVTLWGINPAMVLRFNIDTDVPSVEVGADKAANAQFSQNATVSDTISTIATYQWSKVSGPGDITFGSENAEDTTISASTEGEYVLRLTATDIATNSTYDDMTLVWDQTAPTLSISSSADNYSTTDSTIAISGTSSDTVSGIFSVTIDGVLISNPSSFSTTVSLNLGSNTITVIATDNAGNSTTKTLTLTRASIPNTGGGGIARSQTPTPTPTAEIANIKSEIAQTQTLIAGLQAKLKNLLGQPLTAGIQGIPADFTFQLTLKPGKVANDVKYLQIILNSAPDTKLTQSGSGSPGKETSFFGPLTKQSVIKFQEKYSSEILAPWGLTKGTGFVGTATRAKINSLMGR